MCKAVALGARLMIQTYIKGNKIVIKIINASINIFTSNDLAKFLYKIPIDSDENIVIDMGEVIDIDSSGLGQLIRFWQHLRSNNCRMALVNCSPKIDLVLRTTNVSKMIPVYSSVDEAWPLVKENNIQN